MSSDPVSPLDPWASTIASQSQPKPSAWSRNSSRALSRAVSTASTNTETGDFFRAVYLDSPATRAEQRAREAARRSSLIIEDEEMPGGTRPLRYKKKNTRTPPVAGPRRKHRSSLSLPRSPQSPRISMAFPQPSVEEPTDLPSRQTSTRRPILRRSSTGSDDSAHRGISQLFLAGGELTPSPPIIPKRLSQRRQSVPSMLHLGPLPTPIEEVQTPHLEVPAPAPESPLITPGMALASQLTSSPLAPLPRTQPPRAQPSPKSKPTPPSAMKNMASLNRDRSRLPRDSCDLVEKYRTKPLPPFPFGGPLTPTRAPRKAAAILGTGASCPAPTSLRAPSPLAQHPKRPIRTDAISEFDSFFSDGPRRPIVQSSTTRKGPSINRPAMKTPELTDTCETASSEALSEEEEDEDEEEYDDGVLDPWDIEDEFHSKLSINRNQGRVSKADKILGISRASPSITGNRSPSPLMTMSTKSKKQAQAGSSWLDMGGMDMEDTRPVFAARKSTLQNTMRGMGMRAGLVGGGIRKRSVSDDTPSSSSSTMTSPRNQNEYEVDGHGWAIKQSTSMEGLNRSGGPLLPSQAIQQSNRSRGSPRLPQYGEDEDTMEVLDHRFDVFGTKAVLPQPPRIRNRPPPLALAPLPPRRNLPLLTATTPGRPRLPSSSSSSNKSTLTKPSPSTQNQHGSPNPSQTKKIMSDPTLIPTSSGTLKTPFVHPRPAPIPTAPLLPPFELAHVPLLIKKKPSYVIMTNPDIPVLGNSKSQIGGEEDDDEEFGTYLAYHASKAVVPPTFGGNQRRMEEEEEEMPVSWFEPVTPTETTSGRKAQMLGGKGTLNVKVGGNEAGGGYFSHAHGGVGGDGRKVSPSKDWLKKVAKLGGRV